MADIIIAIDAPEIGPSKLSRPYIVKGVLQYPLSLIYADLAHRHPEGSAGRERYALKSLDAELAEAVGRDVGETRWHVRILGPAEVRA
jgi:hypothetical protein